MRMTFKSVAVAVALVTAGLTAAPAMARNISPNAEVVMVRDHGSRADRRDRYERRHYLPRYERRKHRDRYYESRRYDRHHRRDRDHRRDRRGNDVIIRLN